MVGGLVGLIVSHAIATYWVVSCGSHPAGYPLGCFPSRQTAGKYPSLPCLLDDFASDAGDSSCNGQGLYFQSRGGADER